jgi:hypothetical protein
MPPLLFSVFLVAHALIHLSFVSPRPKATAGGPAWPFDLDRSWILTPLRVPPSWLHTLGVVLLVLILGGASLAAATSLGIGPDSLFVPGIVLASVASAGMLLLLFHPWLTLGIVIDVALLWAVLVAGWRPEGL